jgi:hypothetical protein
MAEDIIKESVIESLKSYSKRWKRFIYTKLTFAESSRKGTISGKDRLQRH